MFKLLPMLLAFSAFTVEAADLEVFQCNDGELSVFSSPASSRSHYLLFSGNVLRSLKQQTASVGEVQPGFWNESEREFSGASHRHAPVYVFEGNPEGGMTLTVFSGPYRTTVLADYYFHPGECQSK